VTCTGPHLQDLNGPGYPLAQSPVLTTRVPVPQRLQDRLDAAWTSRHLFGTPVFHSMAASCSRYSDYLHGIMLEGCQALAAATPGRQSQASPQQQQQQQKGQQQSQKQQLDHRQLPAKQQQQQHGQQHRAPGGKRRDRSGGGVPPKNSKAAQLAAQQASEEATWRALRVRQAQACRGRWKFYDQSLL
jgi:hypothetical protein